MLLYNNLFITDQFTQVVWNNTTSIAVDIEIIENRLYLVVVYSPAGNEKNNYRANVGDDNHYRYIFFNNSELQILRILESWPPVF